MGHKEDNCRPSEAKYRKMFCPTIQLGLLASIFAASCSGLDVGGSHPETTKPLNTTQHGPDFVPDAVLVVTVENITLPCIEGKRPTVVVNGTLPGPELRIKEGQTTWIRVYNNMSDMNTTMVRLDSNALFGDIWKTTARHEANNVFSTGTD